MCANEPGNSSVPAQTLRRLPLYYNYLNKLHEGGTEMVSSVEIARNLRLGEVQVRKDMALISEKGGRPRTGFHVTELIACIKTLLGYDKVDTAVLVGAGNLGQALLSYSGFQESGVDIVAGFDVDPDVIGKAFFGKQVLPIEKLPDLCGRMHIKIGIITVPASHAQEVCNAMVSSGILAIWNFAPTHLDVPEGILIQYENMAAALAMLSRNLEEKIRKSKG